MKPRRSPRLAAKGKSYCSKQASAVRHGKKKTKLASNKCQSKGPAKK